MQTGQNSTDPENSLPQLGQVRRGSAFMDLSAVQPQSEPKATPSSNEWCEIGQRHPLANDGSASIASLYIQPRLARLPPSEVTDAPQLQRSHFRRQFNPASQSCR